jgi:hypothetical protein
MTHGACPPEQQIAAFIDGTLAVEDQEQIRRHIDSCQECFDLAALLGRITAERPPVVQPELRARVLTPASSFWVRRVLPATSAAAVFLVAVVWWKAPGHSTLPAAPAIAPTMATADTVRSSGEGDVVRLEQPRDGDLVIGRPELRWTGPAEATSYEVQVTTSAGEPIWKRQVDGAQHAIRLETDLPAGRHCYVWVAAYLAEGRRVTSNVVRVTAAEP